MFKRAAFTVLSLFAAVLAGAQTQSPFAPPRASLHYAPDRTCDLMNVAVDLDVDYPNRTITGKVVNTMAALRSGVSEIVLQAGNGLEIKSLKVNGVTKSFTRKGTDLVIETGPLTKGAKFDVEISYEGKNAQGRSFGAGGGGWHWMSPNEQNPNRIGFWTQGESQYNSEWVPTWDYPNDLTTSETRTTVPADWDVVGNGVLVSTKTSPDKKSKTFDWKMSQPHATYLLSVVGGPFDIKKDSWEGVELWYVVPHGEGYLIDSSFGHTKDMLSFYSGILGVKYAWPKYAQNAMYDFGGGMENVSATTLGEGSLTESRDGYFTMDSLNSHELGHQWFGDLVTCKDWGDTWLNESFATYMQIMYFEHSRGQSGYEWEIENATNSYLAEARRYKRPISTKMYPNADAMFDSHTYPKGGVILHTLRRYLGDEAFFSGLNYYLTKWRHTPVESAQLRRAMTEATGINCEPFWAQWIEKPGHPVLDYTWDWAAGKLSLTVKQTQDTSDGTPVYDIATKVGLIRNGKVIREPVHLSKTDETFVISAAEKPDAVILDPDHEFLRQVPKLHWADSELRPILQFAPNAVDRAEALKQILASPKEVDFALITKVLAADKAESPVFENLAALSNLARPDLRAFWLGQLDHADFSRRAIAVVALGKLPPDAATTQKLRSLINDKSPIQVVVNSINALKGWDAKANKDVFEAAQKIKDRRGRIKRAADSALAG